MALVFALAGMLFLSLAVVALRAAFDLRRLPAALPEAVPFVSVVFAARDEGSRVETTVRRIAAQHGVRLEIVAVDDRSRDDTPRLMAQLSGEVPALVPVRVEELPPGWLGKCHALHVGSRRAAGEWLLFTDGDIWLGEHVIAHAIAQAQREGVEHLVLWPKILPPEGTGGFAYQFCLMPMAMVMGTIASLVNRDHPRAFIGVGAFNLIRRTLYDTIGGHEPLRMEVVDDMKMGALVRRAGHESRAYMGDEDVQCEWAKSVRGIVGALEKNSFAAAGYDVRGVAGSTLLFAAAWALCLAGPFAGGPAGWFAAFGLLSLSLPGALHARRHGYAAAAGALVPFALPFPWFVLWNSTLTTLRQGGVRWRDTFYRLADLRAGVVPRP